MKLTKSWLCFRSKNGGVIAINKDLSAGGPLVSVDGEEFFECRTVCFLTLNNGTQRIHVERPRHRRTQLIIRHKKSLSLEGVDFTLDTKGFPIGVDVTPLKNGSRLPMALPKRNPRKEEIEKAKFLHD
jgi:hypothetical protein